MDITAVGGILDKCNLTQLQDLNRLVIRRINDEHRKRQARLLEKFKVGDLVEFTSDKENRVIRLKVERINAKTLSGTEVMGKDGLMRDVGRPWRVSPSLCRLLGS